MQIKPNDKMFTKIQRQQFIERMLHTKFPFVIVLSIIVLNVILGFCLIAAQVLSIIFVTPLYYIGAG